ncbi:hypothetical protein DFH06DRAFT_1474906 [Mycena polygramma]|nr:hypothetical protein DFH06DRAFT_1474906 [Mycena polygramma]
MMEGPRLLSGLPNELIQTISGLLELKNLLALCRTSRQIHAICLGSIYRAIRLENPVQVLKCCQTVILRKEAADAVRELYIFCQPKHGLQSFYRTFGNAMSQMQNLKVVDICIRVFFQLFCHTTFPRLLTCAIPTSLDIFPFLRLNPTITTVTIIPEESPASPNFADFSTLPIEPIHMPRLENFDGPGNVACSVVPGSLTSRIALFWEDNPNVNFPRDFEALGSSNTDILQLACLINEWDSVLLVAIAKHTPRITSLTIQNVRDQSRKREFMAVLADILPSLTFLVNLGILEGAPMLHSPYVDRTDEELEPEFELVHKWGETSPKLGKITLANGMVWARFRGNIWFPVNTTKRVQGPAQCLKWLLGKLLNSSTLPAEYHALAETFGGMVGMVAVKEALDREGVLSAFDIRALIRSSSSLPSADS